MGMTKGKRRNSIIMLVLLSVMLMGSKSTTTFASSGTKSNAATEKTKNMNLGTQGIKNPTSTSDQAAVWMGSKVYYGMNGNKGILWRVLNENGLLFQDETITYRLYHEGMDDATWDSSTLRHYLNGYRFDGTINNTDHVVKDYTANGFVQTYFSNAESSAIKETKVTTENASNNFPGGNAVTDKLFLLSTKEVQNKEYGFGSDNTRKNNRWIWLRSPGTTSKAHASTVTQDGTIDTDGKSMNEEYGEGLGVNPAFNLNLSNVLFTTAAGMSKENYKTFGAKNMESDLVDENTWKLTLRGTSETLNASSDLTSVLSTEKTELKITHKKASILNGATQVSAMLVAENGTIVYYGRINDDVNATTSMITIPATVDAGTYMLRVFAEDINGNKFTDYASEFSDITINVNKKVEVLDINGLVKDMEIGQSVQLTGEVYPKNASYTAIKYTVKDAKGTEAVIKEKTLSAKNAGIVTITATVENGLLNGSAYEKEFKVLVKEPIKEPVVRYIPVTAVNKLPNKTKVGTKLKLSGTVAPKNATSNQIVWKIIDAGKTNATVKNDVFVAKKAGTAVMSATIKAGLAVEKDYVQEFRVLVSEETPKKEPVYESESEETYNPNDFVTTSESEVIITTDNTIETVTTTKDEAQNTIVKPSTMTSTSPTHNTEEDAVEDAVEDVIEQAADEAIIHELLEQEDDMIITLSEGVDYGEEEEYEEEFTESEPVLEVQENPENHKENENYYGITKSIITGGIQKASFWWWLIVALLALYVYLRHREKEAK